MRAKMMRGLATAAAATVLAVGLAPASYGADSTPPPPMPKGAGYWCQISPDIDKQVDCMYIPIGQLFNSPDVTSRKFDHSDPNGWTIRTLASPDLTIEMNQCYLGMATPNCTRAAKTKTPLPASQRLAPDNVVWAADQDMGSMQSMFWYGAYGGMYKGQWIMSRSGRYGLTFQADGNLVAYGPNNRVLWSSGTWGHPDANFHLQADGNAVIYAPDRTVLWTSKTWGNPGASLLVQDDGNVVVYRQNGSAAWYTGWDR